MPGCDNSLRTVRIGLALIAAGCAATILTGCIISENQGISTKVPIDIFDPVRQVDVAPKNAPLANLAKNTESSEPKHGRSYYGEDNALIARVPSVKDAKPETTGALPETAQSADASEGFELNFENTSITTLVKVILGDILEVGYTIDPRVQGTVSLSSGRPVAKKDLLYVLESALRVNNVVLVRE